MNDFPVLCAPEDGLLRAMTDARTRRFRTAGLSTAVTAGALSVAILLTGGGGTTTLREQPAPDMPAVTTVVPGPPARHAVTGVPNVALAAAASVLAGPGGGPSRNDRAADPVGSPQAGPVATAPPRAYRAGLITRSENGIGLPACTVDSGADPRTLCPSTSGSATQLDAAVCSTETRTAQLHFPGRNDVDFAVYQGSKLVWRWSTWHPDGGPAHTLSLPTGECTTWTFDWTPVDAHGHALKAGDYTLRTTFLAAELADRRVLSADFTLS